MNEDVLYLLAEVAVAIAGFSGLVVVLPLRDSQAWSPIEARMLRFLIGDSLLVLFFALLPVLLALADVSADAIWGVCSALLGTWFLVGNFWMLRGELRDRALEQTISNPVIAPIRYSIYVLALVMGIVLWLGALGLLVPRGQAVYVLGLMLLLAFAAVEFLFFIELLVQRSGDR